MQLPFKMLPPVNRINQGATSLPFSELQPLMAQPSTERNQAVTRLPQGQMWHPGLTYTQPAPTLQTFPQQTSSTTPATAPLYDVNSTSVPSRHITEGSSWQTERRYQIPVNDASPVETEPSAKRTKHESTSSYKPLVDIFLKHIQIILIMHYFKNKSISEIHWTVQSDLYDFLILACF